MRTKKPKCMMPECNSTKILARGLCSACYQAADRLVKKKEKTWAELERRKLAKPAAKVRNKGKAYDAIMSTK